MTTLRPDEKVCPYCAEVIKAAAVKCRYCHSDLTDAPLAEVPPRDEAEEVPSAATPAGSLDEPPVRHRWLRTRSERLAEAPESSRVEGGSVPFLASARLLVALVVLCLVLAGVAGYAWWRSEHPSEGAAPDGAITSSQARDAGMEAASRLTQKVLSYNWKTLDADIKSSEALLAPSFRSEYAKTMARVRAQTLKNQVTLTANVAATSIVSATESKVVALLFVNQLTTAKGAQNRRLDSSRVLVTLTPRDGDWRITKLKPF